MCAAISGPLWAALSVMGLSTRLMESDLGECNHVFIELNDGRVLDPTADQFNWCSSYQFPEVYVGQITTIHENAVASQFGEYWKPLLQEFKQICPSYSASEVGGMVRLALSTLPPGFCDLPNETN